MLFTTAWGQSEPRLTGQCFSKCGCVRPPGAFVTKADAQAVSPGALVALVLGAGQIPGQEVQGLHAKKPRPRSDRFW